MINTVQDIQDEFLVRSGRTTTTTDITDAMLNDWAREASLWAAAHKKWPFTEGRMSTTYSSSTEEYNYPEGWKTDSIRLLQVGGKRLQKVNFNDYQIYREKYENGQKKIFSDFGRIYFINPNIDASGTITVYGQYTPALDPTDKTAITVFSNNEEDGNEAIVEIMLSNLKKRDKLFDESQFHKQEAIGILEGIFKKYQDEQFGYHSNNDDGMFERFDVLEGDYFDEVVKRNRWF